jgi:uncharacterized membrane protein YkoI
MNRLAIAGAVVAAILISSGAAAYADEGGKGGKGKHKMPMAQEATVTIEQAVKAATDKVKGKVIEAELEREHGKLMWELEVLAEDNHIVEVYVDAMSGEVNTEEATMAQEAKVSIEQAVKAATDKVKGKVIEAELEQEQGKLLWELEIVSDDKKMMEVHVDAASGMVTEVEHKGKMKHERKKDRKREHKD